MKLTNRNWVRSTIVFQVRRIPLLGSGNQESGSSRGSTVVVERSVHSLGTTLTLKIEGQLGRVKCDVPRLYSKVVTRNGLRSKYLFY